MLVMGLYCHFYRQKRRSVACAVDRAIYAAATGLEHRSVAAGQRVAGIYQREIMLANGRYAMLDDDMGFFLVPWRPVIEQRLGVVEHWATAWACHRIAGTRASGQMLHLPRGPKLNSIPSSSNR